MNKLLQILCIFILFPSHVLAENFEVPLSAQVNRGGQMMSDCQNRLGISLSQCQCIFTKSLDSQVLSNATLMDYFSGAHDHLAANLLSEANQLKLQCGQDVHAVNSNDAKNEKADEHRLMGACLEKRTMDLPNCRCWLEKVDESHISDNDAKAFLKGKASEVSEFDTYGHMAEMLWKCAGAVVRGEYDNKTR